MSERRSPSPPPRKRIRSAAAETPVAETEEAAPAEAAPPARPPTAAARRRSGGRGTGSRGGSGPCAGARARPLLQWPHPPRRPLRAPAPAEPAVKEGASSHSEPVTIKDLLEAGVHFGHQTRRWNPKMKNYIFGERNGIYIIDLQKTHRLLQDALQFVQDLAAAGPERSSSSAPSARRRRRSPRRPQRCGMPYVTERWLGGLLTNFATVRKSLERMRELETTLNGAPAPSASASPRRSSAASTRSGRSWTRTSPASRA